MRLRDLALAVCLLSCAPWAGSASAQQPSSQPAAAEPHPLPAAAPAGAGVYNVEIIIFRTTATLGTPENWSAEVSQAPAVPVSAEGETGAPAGEPGVTPGSRLVRLLTPAEYQLGNLEARLRASSAYVPVAHLGWAQTASPWGTHESLSLQQLGLDNPSLGGTVTFERGQFLHLGFALNLTIASPPPGLDAAPQTTFVLDDNHRVKLYERNYYDSPAFGVIALVVPAQGTRRAGR